MMMMMMTIINDNGLLVLFTGRGSSDGEEECVAEGMQVLPNNTILYPLSPMQQSLSTMIGFADPPGSPRSKLA